MSRQPCFWLAGLVGWIVVQAVTAQEPARFGAAREDAIPRPHPVSFNQKIADNIADLLRQSGHLRHYTIDIAYHNGVAELKGMVSDPVQRDEVRRLVQGVPGVECVRDCLAFSGSERRAPVLERTQAAAPAPMPQKAPEPGAQGAGAAVEPIPIYQVPQPGPYHLTEPKMPPYAWPTYAPYNNYSRVAHPTQYPYNAWPYIGPCYPFPKIPLGWRSVSLEWQDGFWWYSKHSNSYDWWRLRYW